MRRPLTALGRRPIRTPLWRLSLCFVRTSQLVLRKWHQALTPSSQLLLCFELQLIEVLLVCAAGHALLLEMPGSDLGVQQIIDSLLDFLRRLEPDSSHRLHVEPSSLRRPPLELPHLAILVVTNLDGLHECPTLWFHSASATPVTSSLLPGARCRHRPAHEAADVVGVCLGALNRLGCQRPAGPEAAP